MVLKIQVGPAHGRDFSSPRPSRINSRMYSRHGQPSCSAASQTLANSASSSTLSRAALAVRLLQPMGRVVAGDQTAFLGPLEQLLDQLHELVRGPGRALIGQPRRPPGAGRAWRPARSGGQPAAAAGERLIMLSTSRVLCRRLTLYCLVTTRRRPARPDHRSGGAARAARRAGSLPAATSAASRFASALAAPQPTAGQRPIVQRRARLSPLTL